MSIKKLGTMSDTLSLGLRNLVEELTAVVRTADVLVERVRGNKDNEKPWLGEALEYEDVCDELDREFANKLAVLLGDLEAFEEGATYEELDGAGFTAEAEKD